ncbi:MAG TPA: hypothetical protein PKJ41_03545 [Bryobacteraceae bacterium]|nr:hypothetical protein [Bryobacteraceae bacterium]
MSLTDRETKSRRTLEELAGKLAVSAAQAGYASGLQLAAARDGEASDAGRATETTTASTAKSGVVEESAASAVQQGTKSLTGVLGALTNLNPIVAGLMKIFGGGRSEETIATLTKIERPAAISYQGGVSDRTGWGMGEIDYSASGMPRAVVGSTPRQVVVQVQAIDSRSFLDHRDEIASAVRQALLESHGLGDVMREV